MGDDGDILLVFGTQAGAARWQPIGDPVMGGRSTSALHAVAEARSVFHGEVSLANGGGFASVQTAMDVGRIAPHRRALRLEVLGDGGRYKLGLRTSTGSGAVVYQHEFETPAGVWQVCELAFAAFVAGWRGRRVPDAPALDPRRLSLVSLYTAGRRPGPFRLELRGALLAA
jgi:NADH dehydrogenase [ubiquinone] 1 alpha subcomplex assembly factor 1